VGQILAYHDHCRDPEKMNGMRLRYCHQAYANVIQRLTSELPQLLDKQWYGLNDALLDETMELKVSLSSELFDSTYGYLTAIANIPEKSGFRQAVKDHILSRLRDEAKDDLLDSIRDPNLANKRDEMNFKKLNMDTTAKLLETRDDLKSQISAESRAATAQSQLGTQTIGQRPPNETAESGLHNQGRAKLRYRRASESC